MIFQCRNLNMFVKLLLNKNIVLQRPHNFKGRHMKIGFTIE